MVISQKLNKFAWVCKTICFQHIFLTFQEIPKSYRVTSTPIFSQDRRPEAEMDFFPFFSLRLSTSSRVLHNFIVFLVLLWLPSSIQWGTSQLQMDNPLELPLHPPKASRAFSPVPTPQKGYLSLVTKTELQEIVRLLQQGVLQWPPSSWICKHFVTHLPKFLLD